MKRLIALMMCAVSLGAAAQMPNCNSEIPVGLQEDVVCWFPLENHFEDISSNAIATSASESGLAFEAETSASFPFQNYLSFSGGVIALGSPSELMWPNLIEGAFSVWLKPQNTNGDGRLFSSENPECCNSIEFRSGQSTASFAGVQFSLIGAYNIVQLPYDDWSHVLVNAETYGQDSIQVSIHLNGSLLLSLDPQPIDTNLSVYGYDDMFIGQKASPGFDKWLGDAAHMVWFSRGLDESEINYLYSGDNALGCTDPDACNYNAAATESDDTCDYSCCPGPGCCDVGTEWNWASNTCVVANPSDSNFDGCVQLNDLLDLLSAYGDCGAEESAWQCGDPLEYQGYDYETVEIGEQCWLAENLRYLPAVSPPDLGREDDGGPHAYVYGYAGADVAQAINSTYYDDFGALYNFEAVSEWLLCPIGWHVPAADEWDMLTTTFGSGVGQKLKQNPPLWDGTNELGFNAIKVPVRSNGPGWNLIDHYSDFWTSSEKDANNAWGRELNTGSNNIEVDDNGKRAGCPVRCIKDAE